MAITQDHPDNVKAACHAVLIELMHILAEFTDNIAIVGGWVPSLLIPHAPEKHLGTTDVDIALNHHTLDSSSYATIHKLLIKNGYKHNEELNAQFKYFKDVAVGKRTYSIEVDLITGEYGGTTGRNRRHEPVQDAKALKARGADLVFGRTETVTITGQLPNNQGIDTVRFSIAGVVPFIVMKGIVLVRRLKQKDAYDLEYVIRNYAGGAQAIAELIKPDLSNPVVIEALSNIEQKFASVDHYGPTAISGFLNIQNKDERLQIERRAYETIQELLDLTLRQDKK
jgi:predicted nucleotidyltransferase